MTDASSEPEFHLWETRLSQAALETIQNQEPFQKLHTKDQRIDAILMPFSVTYGGADAFLVLFNRLDLSAVTRLNRQQLIFMSAFLTLSAAILAAGFSRHFTKPILTIRDTVDRLAGNDFDARADIRRRDELGDLAASVGLLGQALSRIDVLRKELIANVSHELRSPLAVIAGYAEMVRDIHWKDPQMREEDLDLIIHEARRMSEMVNDILDYSQLQSGYTALHPEVCSFCALVRREIDACLAPKRRQSGRTDSRGGPADHLGALSAQSASKRPAYGHRNRPFHRQHHPCRPPHEIRRRLRKRTDHLLV